MSPDRAARLHGAVDRAFGETVTLKARIRPDPNGRAVPDGTRSDQVVTGILDVKQHPALPPARKLQEKGGREQSADQSSFSVAEASLAWLPKPGDLLVRSVDIFAVTEAGRDGFGRIVLLLGASS